MIAQIQLLVIFKQIFVKFAVNLVSHVLILLQIALPVAQINFFFKIM
jgi:hypothetical protein